MDDLKHKISAEDELRFQEDLERATAISLESLALEQFRLRKQQQELEKLQEKQKKRKHPSEARITERKLSTPQLVSNAVVDRVELRSRPRPGSFNTGAPRPQQILAPPPTCTRRISASAPSETNGSDNDLISFTSPDTDHKRSVDPEFEQLCESMNDALNLGSQQFLQDNSTNGITVATLPHSLSDSSSIGSLQFAEFNNFSKISTLSNMSSLSNISHLTNMSVMPYNLNKLSTSAPFLGTSSAQPFHQIASNDVMKASSSFSAMPGSIPMGMIPPKVPFRAYQMHQTQQALAMGSLDSGLGTVVSPSIPHMQTPPSFPAITQGDEASKPTNDTSYAVIQKDNSNLIDLSLFESQIRNGSRKLNLPSTSGLTTVRTSVLEAFDPLLMSSGLGGLSHSTIQEQTKEIDDSTSQCSSSLYDPYDPFDFMYAPSEGSQSDPVYAAVAKKQDRAGTIVDKSGSVSGTRSSTVPPPLPPRNYATKKTEENSQEDRKTLLLENVSEINSNQSHPNCDMRAFHQMVVSLRGEYSHNDPYTNIGLVTSPTIDSVYLEGTEIKLIVHSSKCENVPVAFTCDVNSTIEHVILHVICELEGDVPGEANDYVLRVWGLAEYLTPSTSLADYEYVHNCIKLEQDVVLEVIHTDDISRPLARSPQDDNKCQELTLEELVPNDSTASISYGNLHIVLETLEREMTRLQTPKPMLSNGGAAQARGVIQAVKAVCSLLGNVETSQITEAIQGLVNRSSTLQTQSLMEGNTSLQPEILGDDGDYSHVTLRRKLNDYNDVSSQCDKIRDAVQHLIETYCRTFKVNFEPTLQPGPTAIRCISTVNDSVLVHIDGLHRLHSSWEHDEYLIAGQVYHGTRPVGHPVVSRCFAPRNSFYRHVMFDTWLNFDSLTVSMLPREGRLVLVLYGHTFSKQADGTGADYDGAEVVQPVKEVELGWTALQFFNHDGVFTQGSYLLSLWPVAADKRLGPAPLPGSHPHSDVNPILGVDFADYGGTVVFPARSSSEQVPAPTHDFDSLDQNTQQLLLDIISQDIFTRPVPEDREVLWEKRHYLHHKPEALAKVLLAAHSWDLTSSTHLHSLLHSWTPMEPVQALQLLLPCFPDCEVRQMAMMWIRDIGRDELVDYLPQLVQALKHETYHTSPLAAFLLKRALLSPRIAHHLFWLLMQSLPCPQSQKYSEISGLNDSSVSDARYYQRLQLMLRTLIIISGETSKNRFLSQEMLVKNLSEVAETVISTKESLRLQTLSRDLNNVHQYLSDSNVPICLPLSPALEVSGVQVRTSSYFPSNTLPLKINFIGAHGSLIPAIFKVGDDLQQDMLTIQMIRIMDKLWLREGLDLKMVTFTCVPTGHKRGMIEMVQDAETLRKIQTELGLTGSFKDRPIAEWLAKHNPSSLEYERAVHNFTASCAGYSVATYILGICDRHNDNIMLKTSGHLFHIDFGKFLGDAQMFGNFKRDRTPFVLTSDMAYVINGGDKPSAKFHYFVDLCCQAFNIVRKYGNLILNLFGLMTSSGIPGVTMDAVSYVQRALLPGQTNPEAAAYFARMIQSSLKSWFTQFNFFLHNLAQLRFTGDHNDGELLSFIPKTYTMQQEGRIANVAVFGCQKRYDPEKYYVYILRVERVNQPDPVYLFRSYKEFCELQQKLCIHFPLAKCHSLTSGLHVGRSNIKQVAEKRRADIEKFLVSLFKMADEISHSDLVYTFFHPLLRDQEEASMASIHKSKFKEQKSGRRQGIEAHRIKGQLKLSLHYQRGTLMVMIHHARELPLIAGNQEPSTYVKVYLLPDPSKATKRKTKVVRRNCHPSFMEMLEYRMNMECVHHRILQATIWNHDTLQENEFLGGVSLPLENIDLSTGSVEWYSLGNICR